MRRLWRRSGRAPTVTDDISEDTPIHVELDVATDDLARAAATLEPLRLRNEVVALSTTTAGAVATLTVASGFHVPDAAVPRLRGALRRAEVPMVACRRTDLQTDPSDS